MTDPGRSPARRGPRPLVVSPPAPLPKGRISPVYACYSSADWHHAKNRARPGDRIVMATQDHYRATEGLLYTVDASGRLRGPEKVHRLTPYSEWIATT